MAQAKLFLTRAARETLSSVAKDATLEAGLQRASVEDEGGEGGCTGPVWVWDGSGSAWDAWDGSVWSVLFSLWAARGRHGALCEHVLSWIAGQFPSSRRGRPGGAATPTTTATAHDHPPTRPGPR